MALILNEIDAADFFGRFASKMNEGQSEVSLFLNDPTGYLFKSVGLRTQSDLGRRLAALPASQVSQSNAFLLTLLANPGFVDWMRTYNQEMSAKVVAADLTSSEGEALKRQIMEDFAKAMIDHGELRLFVDMIRAGSDGAIAETLDTDALVSINAWYDGIAVDVETFIYAVVAAAAFGVITVVAFQFDLTIPVEVPQQAKTAMTANEVRNLSQQLIDHAQAVYGVRSGE